MMDEKDKPKSGWKDSGLKVGDTITFKGVILARYPPVIETKPLPEFVKPICFEGDLNGRD